MRFIVVVILVAISGCAGPSPSPVSSSANNQPAPTASASQATSLTSLAAEPPFTPEPTNMSGGQRLQLYVQAGALAHFAVTASVRVGAAVVIDLGQGCDDAADFTLTGPIRIVGRQPAPLPDSGLNGVKVQASGRGIGTVHITGRRTCASTGVLSGQCFGDPTWHATVTVSAIAEP